MKRGKGEYSTQDLYIRVGILDFHTLESLRGNVNGHSDDFPSTGWENLETVNET